MAQNAAAGGVAAGAAPNKIEFDDPHATGGLVEAEVTYVRKLTGVWR